MSVNSCTFIGNLGRDPEIKSFTNGDSIANFSIAITEVWKDKNSGERKERTEWVNIVAQKGLVNVCQNYLHKGSKVFVEGKLRTRKWQDQNGNDKYSTEILANKIEMLDRRKSEGDSYEAPSQNTVHDLEDDAPF